jgi:hypothetical protein
VISSTPIIIILYSFARTQQPLIHFELEFLCYQWRDRASLGMMPCTITPLSLMLVETYNIILIDVRPPRSNSRVGSSLLKALNLPILVTYSAKEFEDIAVTIASQPNLLLSIKRKLRLATRRTAPLFDAKRYTRNFESALTVAVTLNKYADNRVAHIVAPDTQIAE